MILILLILFFLFRPNNWNPSVNKSNTTLIDTNQTYPKYFGFPNPTRAEQTFTHHLDHYNTRKHKYPFHGYSLYGFDDKYYYPRLSYYQIHQPSFFKAGVPNTSFVRNTVPLRFSGHIKGRTPDLTGLPSSFHVRQRTTFNQLWS